MVLVMLKLCRTYVVTMLSDIHCKHSSYISYFHLYTLLLKSTFSLYIFTILSPKFHSVVIIELTS